MICWDGDMVDLLCDIVATPKEMCRSSKRVVETYAF